MLLQYLYFSSHVCHCFYDLLCNITWECDGTSLNKKKIKINKIKHFPPPVPTFSTDCNRKHNNFYFRPDLSVLG